jgi:hypothetical protein
LCNVFNVSSRQLLVSRITGHVRLARFEADISFLLGASFADPDYAAALGAERVLIEDKFDHLAAPKMETTAQPKSFFRGIQEEAGESPLVAVQIDNQAAAPLRHHPC